MTKPPHCAPRPFCEDTRPPQSAPQVLCNGYKPPSMRPADFMQESETVKKWVISLSTYYKIGRNTIFALFVSNPQLHLSTLRGGQRVDKSSPSD